VPRKDSSPEDDSTRIVGLTDVAHLISPSDPKVAQLIEQANETGDMEWLAEHMQALLVQRLPPGVRLATDDEIEDPPRELRQSYLLATKPLLRRGWRRTGNRMVFDAPSGHWADIMIDIGTGPAPVESFLFAEVGSPYLLRAYGSDGRRPRTFGSGHLLLLWQVSVGYDPASAALLKRLTLPQRPYEDSRVVLGSDNAQAWLSELFERLATTMEGLCSDGAMRDWLAEGAFTNLNDLRFAVLLSHHLGDLDRRPELVERARRVSDEHDARMMAKVPPIPRNDRGRDPRFWSHSRFMRFVATLPD
jgi:hypothetical protein